MGSIVVSEPASVCVYACSQGAVCVLNSLQSKAAVLGSCADVG